MYRVEYRNLLGQWVAATSGCVSLRFAHAKAAHIRATFGAWTEPRIVFCPWQ